MDEIERHNKMSDALYTKGVNQFTGLDHAHLMETMVKGPYKCPADAPTYSSYLPVYKNDFDWRQSGVSSPVHDQGQ
jgi:hypothetical protein